MRSEGLIRKSKRSPEAFRKQISFYLNSGTYAKSPAFSEKNNFVELVHNECYWLGESSRVIYPESSEVLSWVHDCSYDVEGLVLTPPFNTFILCPPDNSVLPSGMMFSWYENEAEWLKMRQASDAWAQTSRTNNYKKWTHEHIGFPHMWLCWESAEATQSMILDMEDMKAILNNETPDLFHKHTQAEVERSREILRTVIGMLVYIQASKGRALVHGLPRQTSQSVKGIMPKPQGHYLAAVNPDGKRRTGHLVSGHFRVYRHQRFYTSAEWKNRPVGSRISWVDSYVKGHIDPHTLVKS